MDPEDIAQEVLLRVAKACIWERVACPEVFLGFVSKTTKNKVANQVRYLRRQRRNPDREGSPAIEQLVQSPLQDMDDEEFNRRTEQALAELIAQIARDDLDGRILGCRAEGMRQKEMAERLGVDDSTISRRLQRLKDEWLALQ